MLHITNVIRVGGTACCRLGYSIRFTVPWLHLCISVLFVVCINIVHCVGIVNYVVRRITVMISLFQPVNAVCIVGTVVSFMWFPPYCLYLLHSLASSSVCA